MIQKMQTIAIMAILAVGSGIAGYTFASDDSKISGVQSTSFAVQPLLNGHMTLTVTDSEGNIKAVREADNVITQQGENCAMRLLFTAGSTHTASSTGSGGVNNNCNGAMTDSFRWIAVGSTGTQENAAQLQLFAEKTGNNLDRKPATTITWTNSSGTDGSATPVSSKIVLSTTFSSVTGGPHTINEAGLFNSTKAENTDAMFARKTFQDVTVNTGDSLTVEWTIRIGNTTATVGSN